MMNSTESRLEKVPPRASALVESMCDVGYSLQTAAADSIDNSLSTRNKQIELLSDIESNSSSIGFFDDGTGMTEQESLDAMRPEPQSPLDIRELSCLERFGLGRVTASFTWCCQLTVVTKKCINIMYILGLGFCCCKRRLVHGASK